MIYHRWGFLTSVGAMLGRRYHLQFSDKHIYGNMYTMLLGEPGSRKSSAILRAKAILASSGYDKFAATRTTRERFLLDLDGRELAETGPGQQIDMSLDPLDENEPRESYIVADEMMDFIGIKNVNFIGTLGVLWDYYGSVPYEDKIKNGQSVSIKDPTISVLGGFTPENFATCFPPDILGQGFFSRILLIHGERTGKRIAIPPPPDVALQDEITEDLRAISRAAYGAVTITPEALEALTYIYNNDDDYAIEDSRFSSYSMRRYTHLLKLCLIHAAMDCSKDLQLKHVVEANTTLCYAERFMPLALGEFGKSRTSDVSNAVMQYLYKHTTPRTYKEIFAAVHKDLSKTEDFRTIILALEAAGKIKFVDKKGNNGSQETAIMPVRKVVRETPEYVDWSLLTKEERAKVQAI